MTVDELLQKAAACRDCGKEHKFRRIGESQGSWAAGDGHHYRATVDVATVALLRYLATGVYKDPWELPKSTLAKVMARVVS